MKSTLYLVLTLSSVLASSAPAQQRARSLVDPFEKFFSRVEKRIDAQTQVIESIGGLIQDLLQQERDRERARLDRGVQVEQMRQQMQAQATLLAKIQGEVAELRREAARLSTRNAILETEVTSLRGTLGGHSHPVKAFRRGAGQVTNRAQPAESPEKSKAGGTTGGRKG